MPAKKKEVETRRCTQTQCSYYLEGGCRSCEACKSKEYLINTSCNRCLSCENVPGALRWDDPKAGKIGHKQAAPPELTEEQALEYLIAAASLKLMELRQKKTIEVERREP